MENPTFERDERGLIKGIEYKYLFDGRIDWKAMLKPEHLVINRQYKKELEEKFKRAFSEIKPEEVEEKYLLILLSGVKYLLSLRGAISVKPKVDYVSESKCVVSTTITWQPNFETNGIVKVFGGVASASYENTFSWARQYLEAIAENRSLARAVRNFLGINIVANDEIGPNFSSDENTNSDSPTGFKAWNFLQKKSESLNLDFKKFKDGIILKYKDKIKSDPEKWLSFEDIPPKDCYICLGLLEK